jgi:Kef-type K+ transport system membrane component KefB
MEQFSEISLILLVTLLVSILMRLLRQPLIIGYVIAGLIVGPYFLNILHSTEIIEFLSKVGITALLFVVGLGLSPKVLKEVGGVSLATGFGKITISSVIGYFIGQGLGFTVIESLYIAIAITFSSTIIILKLLTDKGDTNKLYGRISIGFLLVEDLVATIILVILAGLSSFQGGGIIEIISSLGFLLLKGFVALVVLFLISNFVLNRITNFVARSQEFLFIASLSWGMAIAALYYKLGLSIEIGALVAGVTLSMAPYASEISSRLKPLRDFFITLFFILLGSHMKFDNIETLIVPVISYFALIFFGNPIIMFVLLNLLGYSRKVGFQSGLTVSQIGEFSLILITLGYNLGHLSREIVSLITLVSILTIASSTYLIIFSEKLYKLLGSILNILEFRKVQNKVTRREKEIDAIVFGYKRAGPEFLKIFKKFNIKFLVVDFNPEIVQKAESIGIKAEYGDASDVEFISELPFKNVKLIISTIDDIDANMVIVRSYRRENPQGIFIAMSDNKENALKLYHEGATHVVLSHYIGARQASLMLEKLGLDHSNYEKIRAKQILEISS